MDPILRAHSPDCSDMKPSFRKPSNEASSRKYRRHSPVDGSDSPTSGSPKHERSHNPIHFLDDRRKMSDDQRRKDGGREIERESSWYQSSRGSDSHRYPERSTYEKSHDHRRHNDYNRYERLADEEEERSYKRSSRSSRESRGGTRYYHTRHDIHSDRAKDNWRDADKYVRDKSEYPGQRSNDKEREVIEHNRHKDKDHERAAFGRSRDDIKAGERDSLRDREARDDRRVRRKSPDYKNDRISSHDSADFRSKESHKSESNDIYGQKDDQALKRKHDDRETDKCKHKYTKEPEEEIPHKSSTVSSYRDKDGKNERHIDQTSSLAENQHSFTKKLKLDHVDSDEKPPSSSKQAMDRAEIVTSKSISNQAEASNDLNAAKVAAIKAAELVNKNLVGGGHLSTEQKKKLLWGNKKSSAIEEPANHRWDQTLFQDRERQEKFNKLMGVKGEAAPEIRPNDKDESLRVEKLNMDLERQYTAGLRRRDGRTVGLGL